MSTAEDAHNMFEGDKLYQIRARKALPILVRQVKSEQPITYKDLADELGMPNPRNLNFVLGSIGESLLNLSKKWNLEIPLINCMVVNNTTRLPGEGIGWFISSTEEFKKLPRNRQRMIIDRYLDDIYAFQKWDEVLQELGLEPAPLDDYSDLNMQVAHYLEGGGERQEHKLLKEYISLHPEILGLPISVGTGETEYSLPSADCVDVFFTHGQDWVIVEVKSRISVEADIYRGIYQCIKYRAVAEAFQSQKGIPQSCRVVLILEKSLTGRLVSLKNQLNVEVIQNVSIE